MLKSLIALAVVVTIAFPFTPGSVAGEIISVGNAPEFTYPPQVSNEHGVKVTVTPQNISSDAKTWDFRVVLETHTRDLSDDLAKSAVLIADGRQQTPLGWEGAPLGGHHRKGVLHFKAIAPKPASTELQIRLTGDTTPRSFKWMLK